MRVSANKLNPIFKNQIQKTLAQSLAEVKSVQEMDDLLKSFLSDSEYEGLAKRLAIAYWLKKKRSYLNIMNNLKVSSATIASVQTNIHSSEIKKVLKNLEAEEWANQWSEKIKNLVKK
jgi:uncharacterized protein YerC